jgi:hypothetical protein
MYNEVLYQNPDLITRRRCPQLIECGRGLNFFNKESGLVIRHYFKGHLPSSYTAKAFTTRTNGSSGAILGSLTADACKVGELGGVILRFWMICFDFKIKPNHKNVERSLPLERSHLAPNPKDGGVKLVVDNPRMRKNDGSGSTNYGPSIGNADPGEKAAAARHTQARRGNSKHKATPRTTSSLSPLQKDVHS